MSYSFEVHKIWNTLGSVNVQVFRQALDCLKNIILMDFKSIFRVHFYLSEK